MTESPQRQRQPFDRARRSRPRPKLQCWQQRHKPPDECHPAQRFGGGELRHVCHGNAARRCAKRQQQQRQQWQSNQPARQHSRCNNLRLSGIAPAVGNHQNQRQIKQQPGCRDIQRRAQLDTASQWQQRQRHQRTRQRQHIAATPGNGNRTRLITPNDNPPCQPAQRHQRERRHSAWIHEQPLPLTADGATPRIKGHRVAPPCGVGGGRSADVAQRAPTRSRLSSAQPWE